MSFANAMLPLQKQFLTLPYGNDPRYRTIAAVIESSRSNDIITATDFGTDGKLRTVRINYYPVDCAAEGSCSDDICGTPYVVQPHQQNFTLGKCTASRVYGLNRDDIRKVEGNWTFSQHALTQIRSGIDSVRKALNDDLNAWFIANVGCQPDGSESKQISLTDPTTGAIRPMGLFEIQRTLQDAGMGEPFVIGGADVFTWEKGLAIGGLNALGQRIDSVPLGNAYYDKGMETAYGDPTKGHITAYDPRALKFISWSANARMFATDLNRIEDLNRMYSEGDTFLHGTIVDNMTGIIWDLDIIYDACAKQWKFQYRLNWDIFLMPKFACNVDCVNGIFHFTTCLPVPVACPEVTPPTPPTPSVFEWTPDLDYPVFIGDITLGSQTTSINATVSNITQLVALLNANITGYQFSVSSSDVVYTGFDGLVGSANGGTIEIEFTPATT